MIMVMMTMMTKMMMREVEGVQHPIHDLDGAAELFALLASGNPIAPFF